jgi:hypothetical protein
MLHKDNLLSVQQIDIHAWALHAPYEKKSQRPSLHLPVGASSVGTGGEYPKGGGVRKTSPADTPGIGYVCICIPSNQVN